MRCAQEMEDAEDELDPCQHSDTGNMSKCPSHPLETETTASFCNRQQSWERQRSAGNGRCMPNAAISLLLRCK